MINYRVFTEEERDAYNRGNGTDYDEVKQRDNIEKARIRGISVSLNSYLGAGFSLNGGYSFTDAKDKSKDMPIDKSVKHTGNLAALWNHRWNNYYLTVNLNWYRESVTHKIMDMHRNSNFGTCIRHIVST